MTKMNIVVEVTPDQPTEYKVGQVFRNTHDEAFYMLVRTSSKSTDLICLEDGLQYREAQEGDDILLTPDNVLTRDQFDAVVNGDIELFEPLRKGADLRITPLF